MGRVCSTNEKKMHIEFWRGKPEEKRPLGRPRRRR
jgi:hypothetical protein